MIYIDKERIFNFLEVKIMAIAGVNVIIGIALFAFEFSLLNNIHNPLSRLYQGCQPIGVIDIFMPLCMALLTYRICQRFAAKVLANQVPTAKFLSYAFFLLSFYSCFCLYAAVCLLADTETSLSAQTCYTGLLSTSLFSALIPIGEIIWILTLGKSKANSLAMIVVDKSEKTRLLFLILPMFLFLFAIPWLTFPHMILLVMPTVI